MTDYVSKYTEPIVRRMQSTDTTLEALADIIWWIKGYKAGAGDAFAECPFGDDHTEALRLARLDLRMLMDYGWPGRDS